MERDLAAALAEAAELHINKEGAEPLIRALEVSTSAVAQDIAGACTRLLPQGFDLAALEELGKRRPYVLLENAFAIDELPDTPTAFLPIPDGRTTLRARLVALGLHALLRKETIAYRSENEGGLFVNLVAIPGDGRLSEKSTKSMRGHTDAVSFPFPGTLDPENPRISPSPDLVTLVGLRNPDHVPTYVMPLDRILERLSPEDVRELEQAQFVVECQATFRAGTKNILGYIHSVSEGEVLRNTASGYTVRFSHSKVVADPDDAAARAARERFAAACSEEAVGMAMAPGSMLIINNRRALHGRGEMSKEHGGLTRWLLRTYALEATAIRPINRYPDSVYHLFP